MSRKKQVRKEWAPFHQPYNEEWEKLPVFRGWLSPVPGNQFRAFCKFCKKEFRAHRTDLRTHAQSGKHQKAADDVWAKEDANQSLLEKSQREENVNPLPHQDVTSVEDEVSQEDERTHEEDEHTHEDECTQDDERTHEEEVPNDDDLSKDESGFAGRPRPSNKLSSPCKRKSKVAHVKSCMVVIPRPLPIIEKEECKGYIISTQVQDTVKGVPVDRLVVFLFAFRNNEWTKFGKGVTEKDGSCKKFIKLHDNEDRIVPGQYKLRYETKMHFTLNLDDTIFPFIEVSFDLLDLSDHYQVNLLISPFGYMVFRNS